MYANFHNFYTISCCADFSSGIIIDRETEVPEISNFCGDSRDAIFLAVESPPVVVLTKETRWNWKKIDAKDVDPDGESKRERTFSAR